MKYWIEFSLKRRIVDVPDGLSDADTERFLEQAADDTELDLLVTDWDAGECPAPKETPKGS